MKKHCFYFLFILGCSLSACSESDLLQKDTGDSLEDLGQTKGLFSNEFEVRWNEEKQEIDGFGVAQADWAMEVFAHPKRDEVCSLLFGEAGLDVSILRGEVFPHYWDSEADTSFDTDANIDILPGDPYFSTADGNDLRRRGQLWLTREAKLTHNVEKLFFSTWSPPAYMKSAGSASKGSLKAEYYQRFAEFLAEFCKAYAAVGLDIHAISPVNEPNYEAEWNSCRWSEQQLADFLANNMGPTLLQQGVNSKIVFGELAQWSTLVLGALNLVSAKKYVENVMAANPRVLDYVDIAAGHGYNIPSIPYEFPIVPYDKAVANGLKVWLTEISTTYDTFDASIGNGIHWAEVFHKYMVNAEVNAFCWWAGARPTTNNESLIKLEENTYTITKRFETFGNYTRFIKPGSRRINVSKGMGASSKLLVSSYKKDNQMIVVVVNKDGAQQTTTLKLNGKSIPGNLDVYLTDANNCWANSQIVPNADGSFSLSLPPMSVTTFVGTVN
ncbi:MAG: glycoside hydrolase family 30 protein [Bacteroidales bacterium]